MLEKKVIIITFIAAILVMTLLMGFIVAVVFSYQRRRMAFLSQLEELKAKYEQEMLRIQLEVQEDTLEHISREIHDNIGQSLSLVKLHLNTVEVPAGSRAAQQVHDAADILGKSLDDLRDISKSLTLEEIKAQGLVNAIERQVGLLKKTGQYLVEFQLRGSYHYLDEREEIILFRILQESINNIIRHAQASGIWISLDCEADSVRLQVRDNGLGFDCNNGKEIGPLYKPGRGLRNMQERARMIRATFNIESKLGQGSTIIISVSKKDTATHESEN